MNRLQRLLPLVILLATALPTFAQFPLTLTMRGGLSAYNGDFTLKTAEIDDLNPYVGADLHVYLNRHFSVSLGVARTSIKGSDLGTRRMRDRALAFETKLSILETSIEYYPLSRKRKVNGVVVSRFHPFVTTGVGVAHLQPTITSLNENTDIVGGLEADQPSTVVLVPVGAGVRYDLNRYWGFYLRGSLIYTTTDYLDGIAQRGNPGVNDYLARGSVGVSYTLIPDPDPLNLN